MMPLKDRLVLLGGLAGHCWVKKRSALAAPKQVAATVPFVRSKVLGLLESV